MVVMDGQQVTRNRRLGGRWSHKTGGRCIQGDHTRQFVAGMRGPILKMW